MARFLLNSDRTTRFRKTLERFAQVGGPSRRFLQESAKALPAFLCEFKLDTIPELRVPSHNAPGAAHFLISEPERDGNFRP